MAVIVVVAVVVVIAVGVVVFTFIAVRPGQILDNGLGALWILRKKALAF